MGWLLQSYVTLGDSRVLLGRLPDRVIQVIIDWFKITFLEELKLYLSLGLVIWGLPKDFIHSALVWGIFP